MPSSRNRTAALLAAALLVSGAPAACGPPPALAAQCEGDECQGPAPAPEEVVPGTAVAQGPPNPPVRFPASHQPKKHHKKHHRGHPREGARHRGQR